MDKDITLLVFPAETTAVIVPGGDDPAYAAHQAELEQAILNQAATWESEVGGQVVSVSDAAVVAAQHTWPTYVASAGAHALLQDYEAGTPPPGFDCPTCSFPARETTNLICQTCGWDYSRGEKPKRATGADQ